MNGRPRLLFLAYTFPPLQTSGCVRTWNIAKYLSRMGWHVTIVTPHSSFYPNCNATIGKDLRTVGIHRISTGHDWCFLLNNYWSGSLGSMATRVGRRFAQFLDVEPAVGWIKAVERACRRVTSNEVDVVLATGPPFVAFDCARRLGYRLQRPYVLDYRDAWTGSPFVSRSPRRVTVNRERQLLRHSAAITVVSPSSASDLDHRFNVGSKLHVVTNGYDPEELAGITPHNFGHFAIVYAGIFYPPVRVVTPLMSAIRLLNERLRKNALRWKFHYYGNHDAHVRREAERYGVMDRVELHGPVSRTEVLAAIKGAGVTAVVQSTADSGTPKELGVVPGKVFEPIGLGAPILLIAPPASDIREIVKDCCKARCFTGSETKEMARFLFELMQTENTGEGRPTTRYSWRFLAGTLDTILRRCLMDGENTSLAG
jgi:glycosyltransferase involved in cell wall biosynthesis